MFIRRSRLLVGAAVLVAIGLLTLPYGLPNDIRYEIGAKEVSPAGPAGTFTHRPLLYRLLTSAMVAPVEPLVDHRPVFELIVRGEAVLLAAVAALLLGVGLRRYRPEVATAVAVAVFGAQVLMNPAFTLEPEWLATTVTVAAVGAGLAFSRTWAGSAVGGVLLAAATAVKVVSLPIALIGLVALVVIDRKRAIGAAVAAAVSGGLYLVGLIVVFPREISWLFDMQTVQPVPLPLTPQLSLMARYAINVVVMWPVLALLPAALVAARRKLKIATAVALLLGWLPAQLQQHFYIYHAAALPVVGAAAVAAAIVRRPRPAEAIALVALSVWTGVLMSMPKSVRIPYAPLWLALTVGIGIIAWWWRRRSLRTPAEDPVTGSTYRAPTGLPTGGLLTGGLLTGGLLTGGLVAITMVPLSLPTAAESLSLPASSARNEFIRQRSARFDGRDAKEIHQRISRDTPVTYLTFGDMAYFIKNPTTCRYPSPVFLQRDSVQHVQEDTRSWREALGCLTRPGRWLVWDTGWFRTDGQPPAVLLAIDRNFDCRRGFRAGKVWVCPHR